MRNGKYVTELSIDEVIAYHTELREKPFHTLTGEELEDYEICKEKLILYAYQAYNLYGEIKRENPCFRCYTGAIGECAMTHCKHQHETWSRDVESPFLQ